MKNVRIWFEKKDECRYISHLDLNRCMLRAVHKSRLPVWHTEGFNPHPFITFPLPLSLGFYGKKESMDIRFLKEDYPYEKIVENLNKCLPSGLHVYKATDAVMKAGEIEYCEFTIELTSDEISVKEIYTLINQLFKKQEILVDKKSKSGIKEINIKQYFKEYSISENEDNVTVHIILPGGSTTNINPNLILNAFEKYYGKQLFAYIIRENILNKEGKPFE